LFTIGEKSQTKFTISLIYLEYNPKLIFHIKRSYGMDEKTANLLKEAGVKLRQHSPPSKISMLEKNDIEPMEQV